MVDFECFNKEVECFYKNERYSVRDNGAVFRYPRDGKRLRKYDGFWTFGIPNETHGYMEIASVRVHIIVATAFHGPKPTKEYVVDHIDTNRRNNRPDNLRWVTRLENALENPITRKRIILCCGSIEAFLANPSMLRESDVSSDFSWMRTVTDAEAKVSKERLLAWAESDKQLQGGGLGEWLYSDRLLRNDSKISEQTEDNERKTINVIQSLTPGAVQEIYFLNDKPNEYPCTPQKHSENPLMAYAANLIEGTVFWRNNNRDREYVVVKYGFSKDGESLYVMTKSAYVWRDTVSVPIIELGKDEYREEELNYQIGEVCYQDNVFVHKRVGTGFMPREYLEEMFSKCIGAINHK